MIEKDVKELAREWLYRATEDNSSKVNEEMDKFVNLYIAYNALYSQSTKILAEDNIEGLKSLKDSTHSSIESLELEIFKKIKSLDFKNLDEVKTEITEKLNSIENLKDKRKEINKKLKNQIQTHDKVSATENISQFLGEEELYKMLLKEESNINIIIKVIEKKIFYFSTKVDNETPDFKEDTKLIKKIKGCLSIVDGRGKQEFNKSLLSLIYAARCNMFHGQKDPRYQRLDVFNAMNSILEKIIRYILDNK